MAEMNQCVTVDPCAVVGRAERRIVGFGADLFVCGRFDRSLGLEKAHAYGVVA